MLGDLLDDPLGVEHGGSMRGMELLPLRTCFTAEKIRTRVTGVVRELSGFFSCLSGAEFEGYEIHMGETELPAGTEPFSLLGGDRAGTEDGASGGGVIGSYVHGLFDSGSIADRLAEKILAGKGMTLSAVEHIDPAAYKESQYNLLADHLLAALDMQSIYSILLTPPPKKIAKKSSPLSTTYWAAPSPPPQPTPPPQRNR